MKIRASHLFYGFVLVLVSSVYYFDYYKVEEDNKKTEQNSIMVPFLKDTVTRIEIKNFSGEMEIEKSEKGWNLKKPVIDLAATDETNTWVQSLTTEKSVEKIGEGEAFEWSTYGLDKPKGTVSIYSKNGDKIQLQISEKKNYEGNYFMKKNDEKVVYVGSSGWASLLEKSVKELRDKKIMRTSLSDLEGVTINYGKMEIQLQLKESKWFAPSNPTWRLDQNKVREIVNVVQEMQASAFVLENDPNEAQAASYGLVPAALKVTYHFKGEKVWVAEFGQDKSKAWYAWPRDLKRVVRVEISQVEKFTKNNLLSMRDREEPFVFNKADVKKFNISAEKSMELSKEGDQWKASVAGAIEGEEVNQLLEHIRQLRVAEFLDGKITAPGIETSTKNFILADTQGKKLLELKIGDSFKKKAEKIEKTYFYAKSSSYPDVIALNAEDVRALTTSKLIKAEIKKSGTEAEIPKDLDSTLGQKKNTQ